MTQDILRILNQSVSLGDQKFTAIDPVNFSGVVFLKAYNCMC